MRQWVIHTGDCLNIMSGFESECFDSIVTDPPYGIGFMGAEWDAMVPGVEWARECLRLLKPGGHLVAFGGTRKVHRLACAIEDCGFEVRDQLAWLYWSGKPASPKHAKPAHEPAVLARKPLRGLTVSANEAEFGVGGLFVEQARFPYGDPCWPGPNDRESAKTKHASVDGRKGGMTGTVYGDWSATRTDGFSEAGRWPANVYFCRKPDRAERDVGLRSQNPHPTVKPVKLMAWLVRLVTPEGGRVLDPFAGSGSTGIAAMREGRKFVGIELRQEYAEIARKRIVGDAPLLNG